MPVVSDDAITRAQIVADICGRIVGGESVAAIFKTPADGYPGIATFWRWLHADPEFESMYVRATETRGEMYAEEVIDIMDERPPEVNGAFGTHMDSAFVAWQKNRAEKRQWVAARMRPKRFGDRTIVAGDADNPIAIDDPKDIIARRLFAGVAAGGGSKPPGEPDE